ncbi:MAG: hypothetical protein KGI54_07160 [Pseudomonadota bacterium]|nr:hypothetical protein [Pseudomonadota bacterium]
MEQLKNPSPTRDIEIRLGNFNTWTFLLSEGGITLHESYPISSYEECLEEGIRYLDELHEIKPIQCNGKHFGGYYENG